ncbi:potassium channel family protein [Alicyclobacillus macrosporangiidus]|jgi:hypothetical protein|uniref:Ion channel n=1 Tax=Alicyclobacillus macrosporangiidus TaxID=392015 RepID=A0A1I7F1I3_9BACL|nr:potassium channel family protein [Alicyclobacillus macrosporangiidus]SFU30071.1 Ion channel [Alicyclobacillus macrosporangiidus]
MLARLRFTARTCMILCYLIGQVSILCWLYPPPRPTRGMGLQMMDLLVLSAVTIGIVYEWFKVLPRASIRQAVLFMLSIIFQVVELFAFAYYLIVCVNPASFSMPDGTFAGPHRFGHGYEFLYYSVTTFTGTGYGDVTPASAMAKEFASTEMLVGWIMSTLMMALLGSKISQLFFRRRGR